MRILFHDPDTPQEAAERRQVIEKIDAWWSAFGAKRTDLGSLFNGGARWDLPQWMEEHLRAISPELMWEFGPAVRGEGHRLVITPESERHLRPLVDLILSRAPALPGWEFYPYRLAETMEQAQSTVEGRTGGSLEGVKASAVAAENGLVDLTFFSPRCTSPEDEQAHHDAFVATESLLGEEALDKWIGAIEVRPLPRERRLLGIIRGGGNAPQTVPLDQLTPAVDTLIAAALGRLPTEPCWAFVETAEWTLFELKPEEPPEQPAGQMPDFVEQSDLFVARTPLVSMRRHAHSGMPFYSERYSRCGETFCYVKIDGTDGLPEDGFGGKDEIEDALDAALVPAKLGCSIGGGTGLRYSYVDLALTDVRPAVDCVRRVLSEGKVPLRTWVLFYDSVLAEEWVGIYPDTPPPPMSE